MEFNFAKLRDPTFKREQNDKAMKLLIESNSVCKEDRDVINKVLNNDDECEEYTGVDTSISEVTGPLSDGLYEKHLQKAKEMTELLIKSCDETSDEDMKDFIDFSEGCDPNEWFDGYEESGKMKQCHTAQDRPRVSFGCAMCPLARLLNNTEGVPITHKYVNGMYFKPAIIHLSNEERKRLKQHKVLHSHMMKESVFTVNGKQSRGIFVSSEYWGK